MPFLVSTWVRLFSRAVAHCTLFLQRGDTRSLRRFPRWFFLLVPNTPSVSWHFSPGLLIMISPLLSTGFLPFSHYCQIIILPFFFKKTSPYYFSTSKLPVALHSLPAWHTSLCMTSLAWYTRLFRSPAPHISLGPTSAPLFWLNYVLPRYSKYTILLATLILHKLRKEAWGIFLSFISYESFPRYQTQLLFLCSWGTLHIPHYSTWSMTL